MTTNQVRFCGFGGQGVILAGMILGDASVADGKWGTSSSTYGPAARGGGCRSDVVISDQPIAFPQVIKIDVLVSLSQEGYDRYLGGIKGSSSIVIYDGQIVPKEFKDLRQVQIPATKTAVEEVGNEIVANMIILGSMVAITSLVSREALLEATKRRVPERFQDLNLQAIHIGLRLGSQTI
jgi:2-oxoglutarate ferredoxin oxidoreductase subunit gamma